MSQANQEFYRLVNPELSFFSCLSFDEKTGRLDFISLLDENPPPGKVTFTREEVEFLLENYKTAQICLVTKVLIN